MQESGLAACPGWKRPETLRRHAASARAGASACIRTNSGESGSVGPLNVAVGGVGPIKVGTDPDLRARWRPSKSAQLARSTGPKAGAAIWLEQISTVRACFGALGRLGDIDPTSVCEDHHRSSCLKHRSASAVGRGRQAPEDRRDGCSLRPFATSCRRADFSSVAPSRTACNPRDRLGW
jgi:hypothetical protein